MNEKNFEVYDGVEVAPPAILRKLRTSGYGSIPDLPDDELASPDELEKAYYHELWGPVFQISKPKLFSNDSVWECYADVDYNAFASVDFDRIKPTFDVAKYKAGKLKEQLKDLVIMIRIINDRIQGKAKHKILRCVKAGIIDADDIDGWDMWQLARLYLKALGLRKQITELYDKSRQRRQQQYEKWLDSLG